jgi:zinc/manganese transport system permease protein
LGQEVLKRGIIFIDLALAQIAGLGLILANALGAHIDDFAVQLLALASALAGAALLAATEKWLGRYQEAAIGVLFVLAATGSILLLANNPHGGEHLKDILVGQILWVEWAQLWMPLLIGLVVLSIHCFAHGLLATRWFYWLLAASITVSVQLVGVYLVFAFLIVPAMATVRLATNKATMVAILIGVMGSLLGLIISLYLDLPSGALMVWAIVVTAIIFVRLQHSHHGGSQLSR